MPNNIVKLMHKNGMGGGVLRYECDEPIYGFQARLVGATLTGIDAPAFNFVQFHSNRIYMLSISGASLPPGFGDIFTYSFLPAGADPVFMDIVVPGYGGIEYPVEYNAGLAEGDEQEHSGDQKPISPKPIRIRRE